MMCLCYLQNFTQSGEPDEANLVQNAEAIAKMQRIVKDNERRGLQPIPAEESELS